ncbi:hypothetical protein LTR99_003750 [Exophiala xenobiotica]|uniref:SnoaL-like domain-containing protein n=1 Tax=Vermiconidia calcicola TaxID=1690605 RepID=A0AAV9Q1W3_9PEZI|nr:hypothetical protein LTR92_008596 [Exophiala xenobiotica]KAK5531443.1 hypothetical protein LTR25_008552 [Vermiconidia calcicola]KAK5544771.1 hypothetical protein LTR23_004211 [Chaetothyriales sp. CCFEE 6169]KAK5218247.1 hypothetical protein LTR72_008848 [Exophiala xenobiotica]KAK5304685.1 hypothetical protein LTR99_003750 [Exophiala xenobiotica]
MPSTSRQDLLSAAQAFCNTFAEQKPPEEIFSHFSSANDVLAVEHGLPQLAPFLGREFRGQDGIREYFQLLSSNLKYENMHFSNFVVDTEVFKGWDEVFTYVLEFDPDNKVKVYEIWADSGAAYLASKGELKQ